VSQSVATSEVRNERRSAVRPTWGMRVALLAVVALVATLLAPVAPADAAPARIAELRMLELVNQERAARGLPTLRERYDIRDVAYAWSAHMGRTGTFAHNPRYSSQICCWSRIAENIAYSGGRTDAVKAAEHLHRQLMGSSGHRANILGSSYREVGIGIWFDGNRMYVTQNFRQPNGQTPPRGSTPPSTGSASVQIEVDPVAVRKIDLACGAAPRAGFRDVPISMGAARAIDCVTWWEVASGYSDGTYRPGNAVTRAQMATFVANTIEAAGGTLPAGDRSRFRDVSGPHADAIGRLAAAGVVKGCDADRYCPGDRVTRAQMASFLARAWQEISGQALPRPSGKTFFVDVGSGGHADNINRVAGAGIAAGVKAGYYEPGRSVSRSQMAAFLSRTLDLGVATQGISPPG
jgi:hypothetical protein